MASEQVERALAQINSRFKKPAVFTLEGEMAEKMKISRLHTGSLKLDRALGGGYPRGFAVELYGAEGGGKTTTALLACAEAQKEGGIAVYVPIENRLNLEWAQKLGVNTTDLIILPTYEKTGEIVLQEVIGILESRVVSVLVIDSLAGIVSSAFLDKELKDKSYAGNSGLMTDFVNKIMATGKLRDSQTVLIGINQIRDKIGVMFGDPTSTPGGHAWKHLCMQRIRFTRGKDLMQADEPIGVELNFTVMKNQLYKPKMQGNFEIYAEGGVDVFSEVFDLAVYYNFLTQRGAYYYYVDPDTGELFTDMDGSEYKWQGQKNVLASLIQDEFLMEDLQDKIKDKLSAICGG